jgi:hypothetical protein
VSAARNLPVPILRAETDLIPRPDAIFVRRGASVEFDVIDNDLIPLILAPKVRITSGPQHGLLQHLGDGQFRYTAPARLRAPLEDTIRYRLVAEEGAPSHEVEVRFFIGRA